jgi:hypothetical protein
MRETSLRIVDNGVSLPASGQTEPHGTVGDACLSLLTNGGMRPFRDMREFSLRRPRVRMLPPA